MTIETEEQLQEWFYGNPKATDLSFKAWEIFSEFNEILEGEK